MNILLISECDKRALKESRRILDQFAERRGERTWQTSITQAGLDALRSLLRKTARKNTAVACHWIRGRDRSELLWIVGDASRFNAQGAVPTNTTARDVLKKQGENDWHTGEAIRLLAALAALLHDLGKASLAFQQRLRGRLLERNIYRHEWVSLRLFQAFVGDDDDDAWLRRLANPDAYDEKQWTAPGRYQRDGIDAVTPYPFQKLPPLAAAVGWLVVTHHRLPVVPVRDDEGHQRRLGQRAPDFNQVWVQEPMRLVAHDWNEVWQDASLQQIEPFWKLAGTLPVMEPKWRAQAVRLAKRLLTLRQRDQSNWLDNPYVMHLARLSLMLADHYYSSLLRDSTERVEGDGKTKLYANTDRDGLKQPLDEHLLGVARDASLIVHALPGFERYLPRLAHHRGLRKRSANPGFSWQDKAADAAVSLRETARQHGAFIINMASTGCGKTLANARIFNALADPQLGMRATYALGLRTLTLQTGRAYRQDLHLSEDELAIRVGGSASRALFEYYEQQAEASGSASAQSLLEEDSHVLYEGNTADHPLLSRALHDPEIRKLISAPMLVCTVDHIVPATESLRAGRQIAPMLRLMSSDLILDELDDYDINDLPALTRLVYWAGMLGTRVLLSSATLPPALVEGMFLAYRHGRAQYRRNRGEAGGQASSVFDLPCLWVDEFGVQTAISAQEHTFAEQHRQFVQKRAKALLQAPPLRRGELLPLDIDKNLEREAVHVEFAAQVHGACLRLHGDHAETDPVSGKRISFGLVRMANIDPLFDVAKALFALGAPEDCRIHLCVYHARFPLVQRSAIEHQLDAAFNRRGDQGQAVYQLPEIRKCIDAHPEHNQLFVVLASPVCEVGRDWDADWAMAEPSSMRSLIQLAGRVQRHRGKLGDKPNVLIFEFNLRHFRAGMGRDGKPPAAFVRPGFELLDKPASHHFRLKAHRLSKLMQPDEYQVLNALPRILQRSEDQWKPARSLVDLEQARMIAAMLPRSRAPSEIALDSEADMQRDEAAWAWQHAQANLTGVLSQQQPFRDNSLRTTTLVLLPDEEEDSLILHRVEELGKGTERLYVRIEEGQRRGLVIRLGERIGPWGEFDALTLLCEQASYSERNLQEVARQFSTVEVPNSTYGWNWHPWLGFSVFVGQ
ncbi:type I-F CRISPR-associated helicase Cas3 [Stagnimonas aquatica]|uniref:Type I-F CRISPR-associated helicase Cas3 n=1 Tax=Stagnimonas aquatica TaxID=2689987 RepID=A0A3N0V5F8_9GAMM|nr:type I-F CRISPR-associated helicase Cas3f [Stagnimonas aquatica]ROH87791.1 type I-F CRISPR-associated helicase Cas3 [Stagnimonas aquatica]